MKLALGTAQFGLSYGIANQQGRVSLRNGRSILKYALENGLTTIDTAISYGDSEKRLGEIGLNNWKVVSKLPEVPANCNDISFWVNSAVVNSLKLLSIKKLYGLLLHCPQGLMETHGDQLFRALEQVKQDDLVEKIGISIYDPSELHTLCSHYRFDLVQAPFNIFDRRLIKTGWLSRLYEQGTELHVRSVFLQGLLLMESSDRPKKFERWAPLWKKYDDWLEQSKLTPLQACLKYALSFIEISKVIIGVDSLNHLKEIVLATKGSVVPCPDTIETGDPDLINPSRWAAFS